MKVIKYLMFIFFASSIITACKKEDMEPVGDIPGLGGDTWAPTAIDTWIYDNLTRPFNIAVKYKWDPHEVSDQYLLRDFVPPKEEVVIPLLESVKRIWADPYVAETDSLFFKRHSPKFFSLFGSAIYNPANGTRVLGIAEGGKKINLLEVNTFRTVKMLGYKATDSLQVKEAFRTVHHEAAHILHQTVLYPLEYKRINVGMYTTNWINDTNAEARQDGFVSAYSKQSPDEDFVEMVSWMLVEGRVGFDRIVNSITGTSKNGTPPEIAKARLREKERIVVSYFQTVWGINFYSLQTRVRTAVQSYIY